MSALVSHHGEVLAPLPHGYEEWAGRLKDAARTYRKSQWEIGDLLNEGDRRFPEFWSQASAETGLNENTLKNCMWVARAVEKSRRRDCLSFSAHMEVAKLGPLEQDRLLECATQFGWGSKDLRARVKAAIAGDKDAFLPDWQPAPRLSSQTVDEDATPEDDTPVMDAGAFGEGLSAERGDGSRPETDGFDDIERMRKIWAKMTPDLHVRFLRSIMTADLFMQVAPDFQQSREVRKETRVVPGGASSTPAAAGDTPSSSHVEHSAPKAAPCEAPAGRPPAVSIPRQTPVGGGTHSQDSLEIPDFLKRSTEAV